MHDPAVYFPSDLFFVRFWEIRLPLRKFLIFERILGRNVAEFYMILHLMLKIIL